MPDDTFSEPKIALNRVYTRGGDAGKTLLVNGRRVSKDDPSVEAYGTVDELNCFVGRARESLRAAQGGCPELAPLEAILTRVQNELFNLGSEVATDPGMLGERQPRVLASHIKRLEGEIDSMNAQIQSLPSFVLPGGSVLNADLHVCRSVCRRAERRLVALAATRAGLKLPARYLNRLSDAFFVWSRWACKCSGDPETLWQPHRPA